MSALADPGLGRRWLLVVAAPKEVEAVLRGLGAPADAEALRVRWHARPVNDRFDIVVAGVGKANAAAAVARALDPAVHARVVNLGIAGALPGAEPEIGDAVDADRCMYADEGLATPEGFRSIAELGFGPLEGICGAGSGMESMGLACAPLFARPHDSPAGVRVHRGALATVSTCSGTHELAAGVRARTGALAEDMESAAVAFTAARLAPGLPISVVRTISNTTGDRGAQAWDVGAALASLRRVAERL